MTCECGCSSPVTQRWGSGPIPGDWCVTCGGRGRRPRLSCSSESQAVGVPELAQHQKSVRGGPWSPSCCTTPSPLPIMAAALGQAFCPILPFSHLHTASKLHSQVCFWLSPSPVGLKSPNCGTSGTSLQPAFLPGVPVTCVVGVECVLYVHAGPGAFRPVLTFPASVEPQPFLTLKPSSL